MDMFGRVALFAIILSLVLVGFSGGAAAIEGSQQGAGNLKYGAIAWGKTSHRYGYSINYTTLSEAESRAVQECAANDCNVELQFWNFCGALATTPDGAWGAKAGSDAATAEANARSACEQYGSGCTIKVSVCSGR